MTHEPVRTAADLATLDTTEIVEGYRDGSDGDPEPGGNRSRSYWHGWRNGARDAGRIGPDDAMDALAHDTRAMRRAISDGGRDEKAVKIRQVVANRNGSIGW